MRGAMGPLLAGRSSPERERPDVVAWGTAVSRAFHSSLSRSPRVGVLNAFPVATPLRHSATPRDPGGRRSLVGRSRAGTEVQPRGSEGGRGGSLIARGAGTAGEVTLLLRKSKLLSWQLLHPERVHPSPAEEPGTPLGVRVGESQGCDWPARQAGARRRLRTPRQRRHPGRLESFCRFTDVDGRREFAW